MDGTTAVTAVTDTPDAVAFDTALDQVATGLGRLGDPDPHRVRRAKTVGVLADPQYAHAHTRVDYQLDTAPAPGGTDAVGSSASAPVRSGPTLHVHLHLDALTGTTSTAGTVGTITARDGAGPVARVTGGPDPGARAVEAVERWITGLRPGARVTVTPVVDLTAHLAVDAYEIPDRLRMQVEHRDLTCRFPWCSRTGSLDKDHIDPYQFRDSADPEEPGDPDGLGAVGGRPPPGQTSTSNLAQLCRFHHRVKTHGGWTYERTHDTVLTWTSPLGRRYGVDENGTRPLQ